MKGSGYYDRHSGLQRSAIQAVQDWIDDAVATVRLPDTMQPVNVLDLGSSEGRNAIHLMAAIVAGMRRRTDQPLQTIYSDLASNNFSQLFAGLEEKQRDGFLGANVYPSVVGGSFYGPLRPPGTVHLATCFNAVHWLDRLPAIPIDDFVAYRRPLPGRNGPGSSPAITAAFSRQAERDLVRFLESRARELASGGKLLIVGPGDTDEVHLGDGILDVLNDACLDLVAAGQLPPEGYERLTMPCYFRTVLEFLAPLERADSALGDAFTVDRAEAIEDPPPFLVELRRGGDVAAYAEAYTGFLRAVSEPVVRAAFDRSEGEDATVDGLYDRIRRRVLAEPERYAWQHHLVAVQLTRR
jgi:hypothetical protein